MLRTITSGRRRARRVCCATATPWARSRAPVTGTAVSVRVSRGSSGGSVTAVITPSLRSRPAAVKVRLSNTRSSGCHVSHNPSVTRVCVCVCVCSVIYDSCPQAIEAGIWWPRTKFGLPAAISCPKGSMGTKETFHTHHHYYTNNAHFIRLWLYFNVIRTYYYNNK